MTEKEEYAIVLDYLPYGYPMQQGRTGKVLAKRGSAYYVEIKDLNKKKRYVIKPVHLKRISEVEAEK